MVISKRHISIAKNYLLFLLVLVSLFLSYFIWHGDWQNETEVGLSTMSSIPPAKYPETSTISNPYQIVVFDKVTGHYSVFLPGTASYIHAVAALSNLEVYNFHAVSTLPLQQVWSEEYDFGTMLNSMNLQHLIPKFPVSSSLPYQGKIILFQKSPNETVSIGFIGKSSDYIGQTDIVPSHFSRLIHQAVAKSVWLTWNTNQQNVIPATPQTMVESTWQVNSLNLISLVHSFFVNPQVLTRIHVDPNTVLWTDGSRAVEWYKRKQQITFNDPNSPSRGSIEDTQLQIATNFIRNHGGGPESLIAFSTSDLDQDDGSAAYTFIPFMNGYPVMDNDLNYSIRFQYDNIEQFTRPTWTFGSELSKENRTIISGSQLSAILEHIEPKRTMNQLNIQLGYRVVSLSGSVIQLVPTYFISQRGISTKMIDAVTGQVLSGGTQI